MGLVVGAWAYRPIGQVVCQVTGQGRPGGIEICLQGAMLLSGFNLLVGLHWWINRVQLGEF